MEKEGNPVGVVPKWQSCLAMAEFWAETANLDFFESTRVQTLAVHNMEEARFPFSGTGNGNSHEVIDTFFEYTSVCGIIRRIT